MPKQDVGNDELPGDLQESIDAWITDTSVDRAACIERCETVIGHVKEWWNTMKREQDAEDDAN